ncbi:nodulation efficiency protein D (NfeD) [Peptoniphilus sp. ING2-D1G]|nr:nodulation efficiency protein D (NfeD) [Peptoniphilus sp. ING2-D1G]
MKKIYVALMLIIVLFGTKIFADSERAYVIPVDSEINNSTVSFIKESINKAEAEGADVLVFEIDTYGGSVFSAEQIKNMIIATDLKTVAYVNNKAESAGVLISIACEKLYMNVTSTIGSAETIPNTEKNISFWRSLLRDTAQYRGRNAEVVEAMADSDVVIDSLSPKGKLVNLTANEAKEYGVADGVVKNIGELWENLEMSKENVKFADMSMSQKFVKAISTSSISTLLLMLGMMGFLFEIFSPGFGVGGVISIISFSLFFIGNIISGNSNWYSVFVFLLGLVLIFVEILIPGFGIAGISGIIAVVIGIVLALGSIETAITSLSISIIITIIFGVFLVKRGMKSRLFRKFTLTKASTTEEGYYSNEKPDLKLKDIGITVSTLRPIGYIKVDGEKYEAIAYGGFIEKNVEVEVCEIVSQKIYVRRTSDVR